MVNAVSVPGETNPQLLYFGFCTRMRRDANERSAKERRGKIRISVAKQNSYRYVEFLFVVVVGFVGA